MSRLHRWHRWRPALRMAWRDLVAHPLRTAVVTLLVALPVAVAVTAATVTVTVDYYSPNSLYPEYGTADAALQVTDQPRVRSVIGDRGRYVEVRQVRDARRDGGPDRRDPLDVDPAALLPEGSRLTRVGSVQLQLATGGVVGARILDLDDPLTRGMAALDSGRAPVAPDEVAVGPEVAGAFDLLDGETLREDASLALADGALHVVGIVDEGVSTFEETGGLDVVVPPGSVTLPDRVGRGGGTVDYLVDLPHLSTDEAIALHRDLAAAGVSSWLRDATVHPREWGLAGGSRPAADPVAVAVGALVIGLGLTEVLVLVGAAFAVGARRQGRTLGLLVASGGTTADVRRTVLAQGVWIGLAAAALGVLGGTALLTAGRGLLERVVGEQLIDYSVPLAGIAAIALLGAGSAVLAAAVPAWGVGRLTARQALDGHVAVGARARQHRLRGPGLALTAAGLVGLTGSGFWIASAWGLRGAESPVPVLVGGLSALVLLAGTVLALPWLVTLAGRAGGRGWLPWRLAVRDAVRHRARTTAAVVAIGIVTTGAVFAGFGLSAQAAVPAAATENALPADTAELYLSPAQARDPDAVQRIEQTAADVAGFTDVVTWQEARDGRRLVVDRTGAVVRVVDDAYLRAAGVGDPVIRALADGSAVVAQPRLARDGQVLVRSGPRRDREVHELPATTVRLPWPAFEPVWISEATARRLGFDVRPSQQAWLMADGPIGGDATGRLALYGIDAYVEVPYVQDNSAWVLPVAGGTLALTVLVVALIVALSAADGRDDTATLAAVGAPPRTRRAVGAGHALFVGGLGAGLGLLLGTAGGASLFQVLGAPGTSVPWAALGLLVLGVPVLSAAAGWLASPTRLTLTRRTA